jgi:NADH:ubiquinone oxidoreductase subunit E
MTARTGTWIASAAVAICAAMLLADYSLATRRAPLDDQLIKNLQQQAKSDAASAVALAAEQKRITAARRARKSRDNILAWILIASAAAFLTLAKRTVQPAPPPSKKVGQAHWPARGSQPRSLIPPLALELTFIDALVAQHGPAKENAITFLQSIQNHYRYLPDDALRRLCELTGITPAQIAGTYSFYSQFRTAPVGKHNVRVCHGTACHVAGARQITEELRRYLSIPEGQDTDAARLFTVGEVACLGCCSLAPVLIVDGHTAGRLTPATASAALSVVEETETA